MASPSEGSAAGSGANADAAIAAAKDAAIQGARNWIENIDDADFWTDTAATKDKTKYFNVILDLEKTTEKNNKAKYPWKVMGSTSDKQSNKLPKGKIGSIGPAAPPPPPAPPLTSAPSTNESLHGRISRPGRHCEGDT